MSDNHYTEAKLGGVYFHKRSEADIDKSKVFLITYLGRDHVVYQFLDSSNCFSYEGELTCKISDFEKSKVWIGDLYA